MPQIDEIEEEELLPSSDWEGRRRLATRLTTSTCSTALGSLDLREVREGSGAGHTGWRTDGGPRDGGGRPE
jgi:hypothetical protein